MKIKSVANASTVTYQWSVLIICFNFLHFIKRVQATYHSKYKLKIDAYNLCHITCIKMHIKSNINIQFSYVFNQLYRFYLQSIPQSGHITRGQHGGMLSAISAC